MSFWKRLFGKGQKPSSDEQAAKPGVSESESEQIMKAAATTTGYQAKGWLDIVRDDNGQVTGFWLGRDPGPDTLQPTLRMVAVSEKLDEATYISISMEDYRFLKNSFNERGGYYVMIGSAKAPGEPVLPLSSAIWQKGQPNPVSDRVDRLTEGVKGVRFACPTCKLPNYCWVSDMADDVGANVLCGHCGNISHVPAAFKNAKDAVGLEIPGCSYVPIAEFEDWLMSHPVYSSENIEDLGSYGLWAFCADCKHQFSSTVLPTFSIAVGMKGFVFNAKTQKSSDDMRGLLDGKCPACGDKYLLALMIEIPDEVRESIARERERRAGM